MKYNSKIMLNIKNPFYCPLFYISLSCPHHKLKIKNVFWNTSNLMAVMSKSVLYQCFSQHLWTTLNNYPFSQETLWLCIVGKVQMLLITLMMNEHPERHDSVIMGWYTEYQELNGIQPSLMLLLSHVLFLLYYVKMSPVIEAYCADTTNSKDLVRDILSLQWIRRKEDALLSSRKVQSKFVIYAWTLDVTISPL